MSNELTSVTFEHLHNLPRLKVPEVDLHIFASAHDMFPSGGEVREDTIRAIRMSTIRLDALGRLGVPQTDR